MFRPEHEARLKRFMQLIHAAEQECEMSVAFNPDGTAIIEDDYGIYGEVDLIQLFEAEYDE